MKLYEIANSYEQVLDNLYDEAGDLNEQALIRLEEIGESLDQKAIAVASFIKNIEAEEKAIADAMINMAKRESMLSHKLMNLKKYLKDNMERCGINEIKCPYFAIKLKKNPQAVEVLDEDNIADEYKKVVTEIKIDKNKLKSELLAGCVIEGARLTQSTRLEIK